MDGPWFTTYSIAYYRFFFILLKILVQFLSFLIYFNLTNLLIFSVVQEVCMYQYLVQWSAVLHSSSFMSSKVGMWKCMWEQSKRISSSENCIMQKRKKILLKSWKIRKNEMSKNRVKFRYSERSTKMWKKSPHLFDITSIRNLFSNFCGLLRISELYRAITKFSDI